MGFPPIPEGTRIMPQRTARLDIPLTPEDESKLQVAATRSRQSVSDSVLQCALARAEETPANRTRFGLDAEPWEPLLEALDAPPRERPRLRRLVQEPSPFEGRAC